MREVPPNRVLVVGGGSIGQRHMRNLKFLYPDAEHAVLSKHSDRTAIFLDWIQLSTLDEARLFKPDLVVIANPSSHHLETFRELVSVTSVFLIEKPLTASFADAVELNRLTSGVTVQVGYNLRFSPSMRFFRQLIQRGEVGKPIRTHVEVGQRLDSWRPNIDYRSSVSANRQLGGGVLRELSHEFDYLIWIFGRLDFLDGSILRTKEFEIDVEDSASLNFAAQSCALISVNMDFLRREPVRTCRVICERGDVTWDGINHVVTISKEEGPKESLDFPTSIDSTYISEIEETWNTHGSKKLLTSNLNESIDILRLIEDVEARGIQIVDK